MVLFSISMQRYAADSEKNWKKAMEYAFFSDICRCLSAELVSRCFMTYLFYIYKIMKSI